MVIRRKRRTVRRKAKKAPFSMKHARKAYKNLEKKIDKTWKKLRGDIKKKSKRAILLGRRDLLLLLGEWNYMDRECSRLITRKKR